MQGQVLPTFERGPYGIRLGQADQLFANVEFGHPVQPLGWTIQTLQFRAMFREYLARGQKPRMHVAGPAA